MTKRIHLFALLPGLLVSGCLLRSINPLFTENELLFKPELIGTWMEEHSKNTWTFEKTGNRGYTVIYYERAGPVREFRGLEAPGDTAVFEAHVGQLGPFLFLDLFPGTTTSSRLRNEVYTMHLIPAHTFSRVWLNGDTMWLSVFDNGWLGKMIDSGTVVVPHFREGTAIVSRDNIILTASTEELQQLVLKFAENTEAFPPPRRLLRQRE